MMMVAGGEHKQFSHSSAKLTTSRGGALVTAGILVLALLYLVGTALALLLHENKFPITLWGHDPGEIATMREKRENTIYLRGVPLPESFRKIDDPFKFPSNDRFCHFCAAPLGYWKSLTTHRSIQRFLLRAGLGYRLFDVRNNSCVAATY